MNQPAAFTFLPTPQNIRSILVSGFFIVSTMTAADCRAKEGTAPAPEFKCVPQAQTDGAVEADVDRLYRFAQHLEAGVQRPVNTQDAVVAVRKLTRYYRIGAAHGDIRAAKALRNVLSWTTSDTYSGVLDRRQNSRDEERQKLLDQMLAAGSVDAIVTLGNMEMMGWSPATALPLYLKAASLGSVDGQMRAVNLLDPSTVSGRAFGAKKSDNGLVMSLLTCAAVAGDQRARYELAERGRPGGKSESNIVLLHALTIQGNTYAVARLKSIFELRSRGKDSDSQDRERASRYERVRMLLMLNDGAKVPDLDVIVPLPPAELDAWDGTFLWSPSPTSEPPSLSEAEINDLAMRRSLDPCTGLPKDLE